MKKCIDLKFLNCTGILCAVLVVMLLRPSEANAQDHKRDRYAVTTPNLSFEVNGQGSRAAFVITGKAEAASRDADFWRLILDDGQRTEIPVYSSMQEGRVTDKDGRLVIEYDQVVSKDGDVYPISVSITVEEEDGLLKYTPSVRNGSKDVRVNECFCPLADFTELCSDKEKDALFWPQGLGVRRKNPWEYLESRTPYYYEHGTEESYIHQLYPRATMGWYGVQSGDKFLYVARPDEQFRFCFLTILHRIHEDNLMFGVDHFPMARPGEELTEPPTVIGLLDGDWRKGADRYRAWADRTFFKVQPKAEWVKNLTGFQRIIMRNQSGVDYYKAEDLPDVYLKGAKYGIHTLFLFAWWKEGMDEGYPTYTEPYPGAFKALSENIKKVQQLGGRVILECNAHFMDPTSDFYRKYGDLVKIIDINGDDIIKSFVYTDNALFRFTWGKKQFRIACTGTELWRNQVLGQLKMLGDFGADCVFPDCYGGCPMQPCFNRAHEHGNRVDEEWIYHRKFFKQAVDYCNDAGKVLGTEVVTDIAASYAQFIHGLEHCDFQIRGNDFPQLFRYSFPEVITTTRNIYSSEGDFAKRLKYALTTGVRLDAQLWVCRADISKDERYAEAFKFYTDHLNEYGKFFYDGKFTAIDTSPLPYYIKRGEFLSADGKQVLRILYNASDQTVETNGTTLAADEMKFDVFDASEYCTKYGWLVFNR